jgi:hypothetical protein
MMSKRNATAILVDFLTRLPETRLGRTTREGVVRFWYDARAGRPLLTAGSDAERVRPVLSSTEREAAQIIRRFQRSWIDASARRCAAGTLRTRDKRGRRRQPRSHVINLCLDCGYACRWHRCCQFIGAETSAGRRFVGSSHMSRISIELLVQEATAIMLSSPAGEQTTVSI